MRPAAVLAALLSLGVAGCGADAPVTGEQVAVAGCTEALRQRLVLERDAQAVQTLMVGERPYGWLVRGLGVETVAGAQDYACRYEQGATGPPRLPSLRLCPPTGSPWGCPD